MRLAGGTFIVPLVSVMMPLRSRNQKFQETKLILPKHPQHVRGDSRISEFSHDMTVRSPSIHTVK